MRPRPVWGAWSPPSHAGSYVTPLFEWCEECHTAGVVRHSCDSLTLLAMRNNASGAYMSRDALVEAASAYSVPVVQQVGISDCLLQRDSGSGFAAGGIGSTETGCGGRLSWLQPPPKATASAR